MSTLSNGIWSHIRLFLAFYECKIQYKCRRGTDCKFSHPEICYTYAKFGPHRETNPKGCKGKSCDLLHTKTKWCIKAVRYNKCLNPKCKYDHFKGTFTRQHLEATKRKVVNHTGTGHHKLSPHPTSFSSPNCNSYAQVTRITNPNLRPKSSQSSAFLEEESLGLRQLMIKVIDRMGIIEQRLNLDPSALQL